MDKLNKKLAEWAGFKHIYKATNGGWYYYEYQGGVNIPIPDFTQSLDACFEWLVPKALEMLAKKGYVPPIMKLFQLWYDELVTLTGDSSNVQQSALALCKAIEKLIDGG